MRKTVYNVAVGDDATEAPRSVYRVVAEHQERATEIAAAHSKYALAWPLGAEPNDVVSEEGILEITDMS
jgi:hypothetical protein